MTRVTSVMLLVLGLGCGGGTSDGEAYGVSNDDTTVGDEPNGEGTEVAADDTTVGDEPSGPPMDVVGRCREVVGGRTRYDVAMVDALMENAASCDDLTELVGCLRSAGPAEAQQERAQVLAESCGG